MAPAPNSKTSTTTTYLVTYGPKPHAQRKRAEFPDEGDAAAFFRQRQAAGLYADAYRVTTTTTVVTEQLTVKEI